MTTATFRDPLLASLAPRLAALEPRTRAVVLGLDSTRLGMRPPAGGWSVAEVFEHLVRGNQAYLPSMEKVLAEARRRGARRAYRRSLVGGLLLRAIAEDNRARLPTTSKMTPVAVREGVVEAFLGTLARTADLAREADGADLGVRMWSPIAPVPINLGDAFAIIVTHAERHLGQAERTRRAIGA